MRGTVQVVLAAGSLLFTAPLLAQQGAIEGRVLDAEGSAMPAARVVAEAAAGEIARAEVDERGRYRIGDLAADRYRVRVEGIGYVPPEPASVELGAGAVAEVNFRLSGSPIRLEGLDVAAVSRNRFEETYAATRAETEVSAETIRDFNPANAYDALRLVPGVSYLWGSGGRFGKPSRVRGGSTWAIADVIEDFPSVREAGIGAEDGGFTADFAATIPTIAISGVEVKKGSLGVLYGADADGGVIVNQLKRGSGDPGGSVWLEASPLGEELYMADVGFGNDDVDFYAAGKLLDGDYDEFVDEVGRALSTDNLISGLVRAGWEPMANGRLEVTALRGRDRIQYTQPARKDPESLNLFRTTNNSGFYGATFDHAVSRELGYEVGYSHFRQHALRFSVTEDRAHRDRPEVSNTVFGNVYLNRDILPGLSSSLKTGFEWVDHVQEENANDSDKEQAFTDRSVFAASTLQIVRGLTLSGGLRYLDARDDFRSHHLWLHDLGAAYEIEPTGTRVIASWSTGYSRNKGFAYFFGPIRDAGGVDLSENATVEGSVEQAVPSPWSRSGTVSATVFRMWNDGVPTFSGWGAGVVYYQDQQVDGLELALDYPLGTAAGLTGSFTWMDTEIVETTHPEGVNVGSSGVQVPRYTGALAVRLTPRNDLDLSLMSAFDDGMRREIVDTRTGEVAITHNQPYTRINFAADWRASERISLRLRAENLLDQTDLGFSTQTLGADGRWTLDESVAQDPGRILSLGVVLRY